MSLSEQEKAILGFERRRWRMPVEKEHAIAATFGLSGPRYYQLLNALIDRQEAMAEDPLLISRLRRLREQATSAQSQPAHSVFR
ncbi:MAG: DUF3263 domain-containing protein [Propionibacteriaceae bacterium]|jgi:hypothetical protein|nr:DUF3263 domain-containing protein [Propionibacteriaceae bacterium]